jgi:hypothetical protein
MGVPYAAPHISGEIVPGTGAGKLSPGLDNMAAGWAMSCAPGASDSLLTCRGAAQPAKISVAEINIPPVCGWSALPIIGLPLNSFIRRKERLAPPRGRAASIGGIGEFLDCSQEYAAEVAQTAPFNHNDGSTASNSD